MDYYRPVSTRTRAKRDEAFLRAYMEEMNNRGPIQAMSKKRQKSANQDASDFRAGESASSRSFDSRESYANKKTEKTGEKRKAKEGFVSVKKSEDGCGWRVVKEKGYEVVDLIDSDDDDAVVVAIEEEDDSNEESEFITDEESTDEYRRSSSSDEEASVEEEETEKESGVLEKNDKEGQEESAKETSNANVNDLDSSSCGDQDIGDRSETVIKEEIVELAIPEGKISNDDLQVQTEESIRVVMVKMCILSQLTMRMSEVSKCTRRKVSLLMRWW